MKKGDLIDGTWVVDGALGHGGMGSVYRCHHVQSERIEAAIKVLADSLRQDAEAKGRFVREAEILHRLDHPAVVKVRSVRVDADPPYLEMEFVEGEDLADQLEDGPLEPLKAVSYATMLFSALEYLHENEVRHRDLKPENVLIRQGTEELVLVDFGLALDAAVSRLTQANMAFGTVAYAPPEWLRPSAIDPCAWDLYAGGVLLWEMLTGEVPFPYSGEGPLRQQALQVMLGKQEAPPLDPGEVAPMALRQLVRDLTCADPDERPQTATEILARLAPVKERLEAGWKPGDPDEPDTALPETLDTRPSPDSKTEVPPEPRLSGGVTLVRPEEGPLGFPGWQIAAAVALVLAAVAGVAAWMTNDGEPVFDLAALDDGEIPVRVTVADLPDPALLAIALDGRLPSRTADDAIWFDDIRAGAQTVTWAYGKGCALNICPGEDCPKWCGSGQAVVDVVADDDGSADVALDVDVPRREVKVTVQALKDPRKGIFKKTPPRLWGYMAGQKAALDGPHAIFADIPPGQYDLLLGFGKCGEEFDGCAEEDSCPPGCSRSRRQLTVVWEEGPMQFPSDLPLPD